MDELKPLAKQVLARARSEFTPSPEQLARLQARLDGPTTPPSGSTSAPAATKGWLVGLGILVLTSGLVVGGTIARSGADDPTAVHRLGQIRAVGQARSPSGRPTVPLSVPLEAAPKRPADPPEPRSTIRSRTRGALDPSPDSVASTDPFAEELALISRARRELERSRLHAAKSTAESYLHRFPEGSFVEEAEVVKLVAACGETPDAEVQSEARRYLGRSEARFAARVRQSCLPSDP